MSSNMGEHIRKNWHKHPRAMKMLRDYDEGRSREEHALEAENRDPEAGQSRANIEEAEAGDAGSGPATS